LRVGRSTLLNALTHAEAVIAYTDSKLAELLPVAELARFLRLEAPDEPGEDLTAGASMHSSLRVTVCDIMGENKPTEEAGAEAEATDESALGALEDAMAMLDDFHKAMHHSVETRQRMAREKGIKAQEAEALREEVTASPCVMHVVRVAHCCERLHTQVSDGPLCACGAGGEADAVADAARVACGAGQR
jgi:hypothetical protein